MRTKVKTDRTHYLFDNKAIIALIIPLIIEQLLAVLVGMADSVMIASVGEAAVSGVSLVDNVMVLLINLFGALATGGSVVAGQYLGKNRKKKRTGHQTSLYGLLQSVQLGLQFLSIWGKVLFYRPYLGKSRLTLGDMRTHTS